ncbi:MAG: T9SS type A sorting domain-containing protein, partial [Candidatus Aegiribacteria sp.]|nr:T9SS type A sorting domain-containing protein [Candidatus Aegiribacteria sp.]MBD3294708.1 T9SS type A sorting domain-containing protein [Candidatus Fermentibacteria bacterium]
YDVNLFGDPSLRAYRGNQVTPVIDCPSMITANASVLPVQVSGADPSGLTVCLHDENEYWEVVQLDETGYFSFSLPQTIQGELLLTVTGSGVERTQVSVPVSTGPQPVVSDISIDDTGGNGTLSPGDLAHVHVTLLNQGSEALSDITLDATLLSGPGSLLEDAMFFPDLAPCSSSIGSEPLDLSVNQTALDGDVMNLELLVTSSEGSWTFQLPLRVYAPGLYFTTYSIDDSASGNDNGIPEPGETFHLTAAICNFGLLNADSVYAVASSSLSYLDILADSAWTGSIENDSTADFTFTCQLDATSPSPSFPWVMLDLETITAGCSFSDSLRLTVGETGISNDVESGPAGWTHSGTADMWNITSDISHSSSHSWHCGDTGGYVSNMDCGLFSPELILAPEAQLSFWATFDVAIYGTDGMYVIVNDLDMNSADTLDYIGSGGALGLEPLGTGTGWAQWSYSLDQWGAGNNVQLEFRFISDDDSDTGQGFYVDDISVDGAYTGSTSFDPPQVFAPVMGLPSPNPAAGSFSIQLNVPETGRWEITLYDIAGRCLIRRSGEAPVAETLEMDVNGLTPGVYFLKLSGAAESSARLVILER